MAYFGKIALLIWAIGILYVGFLLCAGQAGVAGVAIEAGRISEAIIQGIFILFVAVATLAAAGLFIFVGVLRE